ncbi:hypothetical protein SAMN02745126_01302 [Enhydrobacter aerosaccus]|uniref:Uncharacterized protein n=1 Tax=Enhydrobacter aerosaccus TaxID=225324 RepID=A0A1T4L1Y7_9HYPH|nr:hypothetical protein SAMN02745126_01302 [Enhydrobacter aerosaccus]
MAIAGLVLVSLSGTAIAQDRLDAGGLTFKDFATADHGASFDRGDPMLPEGPGPARARVLSIDNNGSFARIRFPRVKLDVSLPLGWQAFEEAERGIAYNADMSYRLLAWPLDFPFEGVRDAEHYAATKGGTILARHPGAKVQAHKLTDGSFLIVYENIKPTRADREPRTVFDLVIPNPKDAKAGILMTLGVPGSQAERGLRLMALIKSSIKVDW